MMQVFLIQYAVLLQRPYAMTTLEGERLSFRDKQKFFEKEIAEQASGERRPSGRYTGFKVTALEIGFAMKSPWKLLELQ